MQEQYAPMLRGQDQNLVFAFDRDEVPALQENVDARNERSRKDLAAGTITINEHRVNIEREAIPQGDVLLIPSSSIPVTISGAGISTATPVTESVRTIEGQTKMLAEAQTDVTDLDRSTWNSFIKRFNKAEEDFHELMDKLFKEQREDTLRNLGRTVKAVRGVKAQNDILKAGPQDIFQGASWLATFVDVGRPVFSDTLEAGGQAQVVEFNLGIVFDINNAVTQTWLDERTKFWANHVNAETAAQITAEMSEGILQGEGIKALQVRVNDVFDFAEAFRSERIARTEAVSASNQGHLEAYRQADVPAKRWLTTLDGRQRDTHDAAHGQTVPINQTFTVGGQELIMPGQGGSAAEVVNCRCSSLPVFEELKSALPEIVLAEPYDDTQIKAAISATSRQLQGLVSEGVPSRARRVTKDVTYDKDGQPVTIVELHEDV